jgi:hypothetical protein
VLNLFLGENLYKVQLKLVTNYLQIIMPESGVRVCPVCGVKIIGMVGGDRVLFSVGPPGTRATLWARVCQYTQKPGCINTTREVSDGNKSKL